MHDERIRRKLQEAKGDKVVVDAWGWKKDGDPVRVYRVVGGKYMKSEYPRSLYFRGLLP